MTELTATLNALNQQVSEFEQKRDTWKADMQTKNDATEQAREPLRTVTTDRDTAWTEVQALQTCVGAFEGTGREVNDCINRRSGDIRGMDRHSTTLYRDRQEVGVRMQFAIRCAICRMVRMERDRADRIVAQLDHHMNNIIASSEVEGLTDNPAFEDYEEDCQLQLSRSQVNVLLHEPGPFCCMSDRDPF